MQRIDLSDQQLIGFCARQQKQFVAPASDFTDGVIDLFHPPQDDRPAPPIDHLPWGKTHNAFAFRPGEVTVWGGINGHGKSQMLNMVAAWSLRQRRWLIASMEMTAERTMYRMTRQAAGNKMPPEQFVRKFMRWTDGRLWLYDQTDSVKMEAMLGLVHYAADELKVQHVVIDSLMKCGVGREQYELQADFVDRLCYAAKAHRIHIHLVHHIRKGDDESRVPNKFDLRGAGEITDLADNVLIVWRNKPKEAKLRNGKATEEDLQKLDALLRVDKQRNGEWEGMVALWHHADSMQYVPDDRTQAMPLIMEDITDERIR